MTEKFLSSFFSRKTLFQAATKFLFLIQKLWQENGYLKNLPLYSLRQKRIPSLKLKKHSSSGNQQGKKIYLFEGCLTRCFFPEIRESVVLSLSHFGFQVISPPEQGCCGAPSFHLGDIKATRRLARKNIKSWQKEKPAYIITVCPTGNSMLTKTYPQLYPDSSLWTEKIFDFTEFVYRKGYLPPKKTPASHSELLYHYPCHYLNSLHLKEEPLEVLKALGFSPQIEEEPLTCCGFCGVFSWKHPDISARIWQKKHEKIIKYNPSLLATDCPGCLFQLRAELKKIESQIQVFHTSELLANAIKMN